MQNFAVYWVKGVVDKNFEAVDNFHGHTRIKHGQFRVHCNLLA